LICRKKEYSAPPVLDPMGLDLTAPGLTDLALTDQGLMAPGLTDLALTDQGLMAPGLTDLDFLTPAKQVMELEADPAPTTLMVP